MKWQCNLRDGPSPHRTPFSTFVLSFGLYSFLIFFFFFCNLSSFSFQVSTSFDPYQRAYFYFSTLLVSDKGIDLNTLKSAVIWPWALETVKLPRTKTVNTEQKQPWFNIVNLISLILCSLFFFFCLDMAYCTAFQVWGALREITVTFQSRHQRQTHFSHCFLSSFYFWCILHIFSMLPLQFLPTFDFSININ